MNQEQEAQLNLLVRNGKSNKKTNWVMVIVAVIIVISSMPNFIPKYNGSQNATKKDIEMVQKEIMHVKELITTEIINMKETDIKRDKRVNILEGRVNNYIQSTIH